MELFIRKANLDEANIIYEITQEAFKKYAHELGMPNKVFALSETPHIIQKDILEKNVFIAYLNGQAVGSIRFEMLPNHIAYITRFGVRPIVHNHGIGGGLIDIVEEESKKQGAQILALHTASKMPSLIRFYYGMNFYIHSTNTDRGYIRALLCKELNGYCLENIDVVNIK